MRKHSIFLLILINISILAFSQDIATSIKSYELSKSDIISKGRNLLLDSYIAGDIEKVTEAYLYLNNKVADTNYAVFTAFEQIYVGSLTQNYIFSIKEILRIDSLSKVLPDKRTSKVYPTDNQLGSKLYEFSYMYLPKIRKNIQLSNLSNEDKGILNLTLNDIFENSNVPADIRAKVQDDINQQCDSFLNSFKNSKYEHYVRYRIRKIYKVNDWGFGEYGAFGYINTQGNMGKYLSDGGGFEFGFEGYYKKMAIFLKVGVFINQVKKDIPFENYSTLYAGTSANLSNVELSLGYPILDNRSIAFVPFAGIGANILDPTSNTTDNYPELKNKEIASFCTLVGLSCDLKFKKTAIYPSYTAVRVRLTYFMPSSFNAALNGNQLTLTVGYCLVGHTSKRQY